MHPLNRSCLPPHWFDRPGQARDFRLSEYSLGYKLAVARSRIERKRNAGRRCHVARRPRMSLSLHPGYELCLGYVLMISASPRQLVARTTASRPLLHSPDETSWSASLVKSGSTAFGSIRSRASTYLATTSRIAASSVEPLFCCAMIEHKIISRAR